MTVDHTVCALVAAFVTLLGYSHDPNRVLAAAIVLWCVFLVLVIGAALFIMFGRH